MYRQREGPYTLASTTTGWEVGHREGFSPLLSYSDTPTPPSTGWSYRRGPALLPDPFVSLILSSKFTLVCERVTFTSDTSLVAHDYLGCFTR